jgi:hypothetical protein
MTNDFSFNVTGGMINITNNCNINHNNKDIDINSGIIHLPQYDEIINDDINDDISE